MPIYEYLCAGCSGTFEELVRGEQDAVRAPTAAARPSPSCCRRSRPPGRSWPVAGAAVAVAAAVAAAAATEPSGPAETMRTVSDGPARAVELDRLSAEWLGCQKCALARTRTQVVVGSGDPDSDLMFVGEAPGYHEDRQGTPFVGQAGKVLEGAARVDRPLPARGLHRQRAQVPAAGQPRPPARRDRRLRGPPVRAGRADPAARDLHARQLRDQAPVRPAVRDHPRPRPRPAAPHRRRRPGALPDLPPGGGALHARR